MNLVDGLNEELERVRELKNIYEQLQTGKIGAMLISKVIEHAELSMQTQNLPEMVKAYKALQECE